MKMQAVRWKFSIIMILLLYVGIEYTDATEGMQKLISMTADGWKPIIGNSRPPLIHYQEEIKYYKNPILKETVKAEPATTPTTTATTTTTKKLIQAIPINYHGQTKGKIPPHTKHTSPYFIMPNLGGHGPHIPLKTATHNRPNQHGVLKKVPMNGMKIMKKPIMGQQMTAHSTRNEVYVPAPTGSYSFFSPNKNIRTRENSGLGIVGQKLFSIKQPHAHMEFSSHFPPNNIYQQPVQHIIFQKQQINEVIPPYQIDTPQNLVPPPLFKNYETHQDKYKHNEIINPDIRTPSDKIIFGHNPLGPNDLILQLPSYDNSLFGFGKEKHVKHPNEKFHNDIPHNVNHEPNKPYDQHFHDFKKPITQYPKSPTYEVTEERWEDNTPPPLHKIHGVQQVELNVPPFLPTPYKPDIGIVPTSPTQNEVSTIFSQMSNSVKQYQDSFIDPYFFDVKEVSTHYPIVGKPEIVTTMQPQEGITGKPIRKPQLEEIETTTEKHIRNSNHRRRRPMTRYTTTTTTTSTTTEQPIDIATESKDTSISSEELETVKPFRPRRPVKIRPSESVSEEEAPEFNRNRNRHRKRPHENDYQRKNQHKKRIRPSRYEYEDTTPKSSEIGYNEEVTEVLPIIQHFTTQGFNNFEEKFIDPVNPPETHTKPLVVESTTEKERESFTDSEEEFSEQKEETYENYKDIEHVHTKKKLGSIKEIQTPIRNNAYSIEENTSSNQEVLENFEGNKIKKTETTKKRFKLSSTTEIIPTVTTYTTENEIETTKLPEITNTPEISKITTTSEPDTTTTLPTQTKPHRRRPIKYNVSSRPKFSVKDYRSRFQYSSTSSTTTETPKLSTEGVRVRFPTRVRRPFSTAPSTTTSSSSTEEVSKSRFTPKEPRHSTSHSKTNEVITERNIKSVNTRLRPFGRTKTTTESTPTQTTSRKVSIKPNLFSNRKRPQPISLKTRIQNRNNDKTAELSKEVETTTEIKTEEPSSTISDSQLSSTNEESSNSEAEKEYNSSSDILKSDTFLYSQRVSDLTSSMNKNDYNDFKSVPSNSRRIPNYYTISTEDPILPIEAFFSNINEKGN